MREFWRSLEDLDNRQEKIRNISLIRNKILPSNQIAIRKTFGLNEPGCSVNCEYCTLGTQYTGSWNKNRVRENVEERISHFLEVIPTSHVELVGYWYGLEKGNSGFERVWEVIEKSNSTVVGGDLGIVTNEETLTALQEAGLIYLHNNLETSQRLYPLAIGKDTRRFQKKIETLQRAAEVGLQITSGILIGLGETIDDLIEQVQTLEELPLRRVAVNFMDYETDERVGAKFRRAEGQLTPEYALRVLIFLRQYLSPDRSLMVGCGVSNYLYDPQNFSNLLKVVDTIHIGGFINLQEGSNPIDDLLLRLDTGGFEIVQPSYFRT